MIMVIVMMVIVMIIVLVMIMVILMIMMFIIIPISLRMLENILLVFLARKTLFCNKVKKLFLE